MMGRTLLSIGKKKRGRERPLRIGLVPMVYFLAIAALSSTVAAASTSLPCLEKSSMAARTMSPWRWPIALIDSTAAVLAEVSAAKFLRVVSTMVSTLMVGSLNSPAILVKSKSANGFLKAPLAYIGVSWRAKCVKLWADPLCCGAQRGLI